MHKTLVRVFLVAALFSPLSVLLPNVAFASLASAPAPCAVIGAPFLNITQNITNDADSGVHGNWATDAFTEHISVWLGSDNTTYCANASTTNGTFVTTGPLSPEAGVALSSGITGTFTGGENYTLPFATSSSITGTTASPQTLNLPDSSTAGFSTWVSTVFPSVPLGSGSNSVNTYSLTYVTANNGTWTDADGSTGDSVVGSGGDVGDITGAPPATATTIVITPSNMQGWAFVNDTTEGAGSGMMVIGPSTPPLQTGSAQLTATTTTDGQILAVASTTYAGVKLSSLTAVSYATYEDAANPSNATAIALQFDVAQDVTAATQPYQGRLVFEPYLNNGGSVTLGSWNTWNALTGKWWLSHSATQFSNNCSQASPCTFAQLIALYPNIGIWTDGAVVLKAGSGWTSFKGNVDDLTVGINNANTTYDFEPAPPAPTTGSIIITKYGCPANTIVTRTANGVTGTAPAGCSLEKGMTFAYVHGTQTDANAPDPELAGPFIAAGTTDVNGSLTIPNLDSSGRYLIVETSTTTNTQLAAGDILGLYCNGDGDTSGTNDNQELTFVPAGGSTHCVAYDKVAPPPPPQCNINATASIVSDTATVDTTDNHAAVAVTPNSAWVTLTGSTWVYDAALNGNGSSPTGTKVFTRTFSIVGTPSDSSLVIAADNMYTVSVNGHTINTGTSGSTINNFSATQTWDIPAADLLSGANTITFTVTNAATDPVTNAAFGDPNPGGLLYKLTVNNNECVTPPTTGTASISGYKFEDWDADGSNFETQWEVGLKGWTITLTGNGISSSTVTNKQGLYDFTGLPAGTYTVREVQQTGWISTYPSTTAASDQWVVTLSAGQNVKKKNFGNFELGSISGMKFNDVNGNHKKDAGEPGLQGWTINLSGPHGYASTTVTDANGNYSFTGLMQGTYKLSEVMQTGWKQTVFPGNVKINSDSTVTKKNFGNKLKVSGNKNNDKDDGRDVEDDD